MGTVAEEIFNEGLAKGKAEGMAEGIAEGRAEGQATFLLRLLEHKFGPLPTGTRDRILAAAPEGLEDWVDAVLDASCVDEVFPGTRT